MSNEKKKIDLSKCIAVTSGSYFEKDKNGKWKVKECYKDKPTAKVDKGHLNIVTATTKNKKIYLGDFSSLKHEVKGYAVDRFFNHGQKNVKSIYLVEAELPTKK